jgi:diguanylate cyclase (GGDEF)-like protein
LIAERESGQPRRVRFLDVERFKLINDSYGHPGGDRVLVTIGQILHRCTPGSDIVARYGGDEFLVVLSNAGEKAAFDICKRILNAVQAGPYKADDGSEIRVSISIGCATMSAECSFSSVDDLIRTADRCLYAAKRGGRNRIVTLNQLALASTTAPEAQAV